MERCIPSTRNAHFTEQDGKIRFQLDGDSFDEAMQALTPLGIQSLVAHPPTLEQLLMRHYGDAAQAAEALG